MNTIQRSSLAIALFAGLAAGQAMAADFNPASGEFSSAEAVAAPATHATRGEVMAQVKRLPASGEFSGGTVAAASSDQKTRAEVKADIVAIPASGEFSGTPADVPAAVSAKSREEIRAEVLEARRSGALQANGDYVAN